MPTINTEADPFFAINGRIVYFTYDSDDKDSATSNHVFVMHPLKDTNQGFNVKDLPAYNLLADVVPNATISGDDRVRRTLMVHAMLNLLPAENYGLGIYGEEVPWGPMLAYLEFHKWLSGFAERGVAPQATLMADALQLLCEVSPGPDPLRNFGCIPCSIDDEDQTSTLFLTKENLDKWTYDQLRGMHDIEDETETLLGEMAIDVDSDDLAKIADVPAGQATLDQLWTARLYAHRHGYISTDTARVYREPVKPQPESD